MDRIDPRRHGIERQSDGGLSPWDHLFTRCDGPDLALAYAHVFWPDLVEVDGFVLLKENYDAEYLARVRADLGPENVEATINTTYLQNIFGSDTELGDEAAWTALGEIVRDAWKARAEALFPDRDFVATFTWYSEDSDPGVTLQQTRLRR